MSETRKLFENFQKNLNEDDSFYNELEVTNYRPTGQNEGALANMKIKSKFGELEVNLLNIDGEYRLVTPNMWRTKEEEELINNLVNEYGMQGLTDFAADYHYKQTHTNESTLNESGANLDIDLNTGVLPIVNVDLYSLSDRLPDSASYEELDEIIKDIAPKYIEETIQEVLPSAKITANKVYHPSQYNYSGDELEFNLTVNQDEYENLRKEALSNSEFENFLKSNYSSRSGFISSMPNNIEDFNRSETWKSMVQVIMFALRNTDLDSVNDNYLDEFMEEVNQNFDFEEYDESALNERQDPEEGFEIDEELLKQCDDIHYRGIFTTYIEDTNTLLFTKEKGEDAIYNDSDDVKTIVYRNQTPEQIKKIIDDIVDSNKKDSVIKESITIEDAEDFINKLEYCEDEDDIQQLIYEIPDSALENECQLAFDQCIQDGDDLDAIKDHVQVTFEDNAEYDDESNLNEEVDYNNCVYQLVGGDYAGTYTREEAEKLPIKEDKLSPNYSEYRNNGGIVPREELDDQLQFRGYLGPMYNGTDKDGKHIIRYETQEVYDMLSESISSKTRKDYSEKDISSLNESNLDKVRKDSVEKGLLTEEYNPLNVKLYMNTWGNYNENGADVDSIGGGWMDIDQVRDFLEKHSNEEPFINDVDGDVPFEINEYSNVEQVLEWLEAYENLSDNERDAFAAIMEDQNDDFETCMDILESGDYIFFPGVDNDEDLGIAWVNMVGGLEGVANVENYIDEDEYKESWREAAEEDIRNENPDIDEDSDEFEDLVEEWLDNVALEELQNEIASGADLSDYFDYESFGRELNFGGFYYAKTGAIETY